MRRIKATDQIRILSAALIRVNRGSVLPIDVYETGSARWNRVGVIAPSLPRYRPICGDFDELELDRLPCRSGGDDEPVRIIRRLHRPHGRVPRRGPVTQLDRVPGQEDIVADLRRTRVVDRERDGNELGS